MPSASASDNDFMFEYNIEYGGTLKEPAAPVADSLMAFDITTSAKEAQEAFDLKSMQKKQSAQHLAHEQEKIHQTSVKEVSSIEEQTP